MTRGYQRLKDLWAAMLAGEEEPEREWMLEAEKLVDMFRETRNLFLTSRVCYRLSVTWQGCELIRAAEQPFPWHVSS